MDIAKLASSDITSGSSPITDVSTGDKERRKLTLFVANELSVFAG
jgi:hypothetical protein